MNLAAVDSLCLGADIGSVQEALYFLGHNHLHVDMMVH